MAEKSRQVSIAVDDPELWRTGLMDHLGSRAGLGVRDLMSASRLLVSPAEENGHRVFVVTFAAASAGYRLELPTRDLTEAQVGFLGEACGIPPGACGDRPQVSSLPKCHIVGVIPQIVKCVNFGGPSNLVVLDEIATSTSQIFELSTKAGPDTAQGVVVAVGLLPPILTHILESVRELERLRTYASHIVFSAAVTDERLYYAQELAIPLGGRFVIGGFAHDGHVDLVESDETRTRARLIAINLSRNLPPFTSVRDNFGLASDIIHETAHLELYGRAMTGEVSPADAANHEFQERHAFAVQVRGIEGILANMRQRGLEHTQPYHDLNHHLDFARRFLKRFSE